MRKRIGEIRGEREERRGEWREERGERREENKRGTYPTTEKRNRLFFKNALGNIKE